MEQVGWEVAEVRPFEELGPCQALRPDYESWPGADPIALTCKVLLGSPALPRVLGTRHTHSSQVYLDTKVHVPGAPGLSCGLSSLGGSPTSPEVP